ncbi:MAG: CpsD/CapB family tyrosine-protein kinase [Sedimentibacter saalensis]|uniref:CpsD/CapB family tyrosine-protein kinase n=1 Tax=Sedimentibacter saalensis TaxID=130788 RepID=UPI002B218B73|nr:CpsD/CapB family tyrosine-protein kinase [Sedimentibacter saalensis]MEA5093500.1 CpsD/CapB family tyrosine-protein kinase [Sedimentibacter saalensis]
MERYKVRDDQKSPIAEAYRKIATNIQFANLDSNIRTIMVSSCMASEGKTTTISNLASVMAELNKNILLIDLDLRKPTVHKQFNLSNRAGLTDLLLHKDDYIGYIQNVHPGLDVITSGKIPANPTEIINSNAIKELIKKLSGQYDYIFLDTPPLVLVSDPLTIATYSDAVILTIAHSETEKEVIRRSIDSLKQVNANIIGTILNKMPVSKHNKYYYSYY